MLSVTQREKHDVDRTGEWQPHSPFLTNGMWNGKCENRDCDYHWNPMDTESDEQEEN